MRALTVDPDGNVVFVYGGKTVRRLDVRQGVISTIVSRPEDFDTELPVKPPGVAVGDDGTIYTDAPKSHRVEAIRGTDVPRGRR